MKLVLTTGEVAKICSVSQKTVIKWFDEGLIQGYKIPGTKDRRVSVPELVEFIKKNNIPLLPISGNFIEFYWDYFHEGKEKCKTCIVTKNRILNCYKYGVDYVKGWFFCKIDCSDCEFYRRYNKKELKDIEKFCWEVMTEAEDCEKCLAFRTGAKRCFDLKSKIAKFCKNCNHGCEECDYYKFLKDLGLIEHSTIGK